MYSIEEFDNKKTKVLKYILYKKRTEQEVKNKFRQEIDEILLDDIIEYLKENNYINDYEYIEKPINEYINLKNLSIKDIKYKLLMKGLNKKDIEEYIDENYEKLIEYERKSKEKIKLKKENVMSEEEIEEYLYKKGYN